MRRYWISPEYLNEDTVVLEGDVFHHIFDVCRQEKGSKFEVITNGKAYFVQAEDVRKKNAIARILEVREVVPLQIPFIKLALCVPRFPVLESVLEKAVEMGVHSIQLLTSDYSFIKSSEKISDNKWERWQKIIVSATQQCGRGELMSLAEPIPFQKFIEKMDPNASSLCLFGYEGEKAMDINEYLRPLADKSWDDAWLVVGGEGGFSHEEAQNLKDRGVQPVTLGDQILRVETACIALTSVLKYELGLMRKRK